MNTSKLSWRLVIFVFLLVIVLPVSFIFYRTYDSYPGYRPVSSGPITNVWVLQNSLPQSVVDIAKNQVSQYAQTHNGYNTYQILSGLKVADGQYTFSLGQPNGVENMKVGLLVDDIHGVLSVQTYINDQLQTVPDPSSL